MHGLEGAVMIPLVILASAAILYVGFIGVRRRRGADDRPAAKRQQTPDF